MNLSESELNWKCFAELNLTRHFVLHQALQLAVTRRLLVEQYWKWRIIVKCFAVLQVYISGFSIMLSSQSDEQRLYKVVLRTIRISSRFQKTMTFRLELFPLSAGTSELRWRGYQVLVLYSCSFLQISHTTQLDTGRTEKLLSYAIM